MDVGLTETQLGRRDQQIAVPLTQVFETVTSKVLHPQELSTSSREINDSLDKLFPEQEYEERNIQKAREKLGELANNFSKDELRDLVAQVEYLAETWLDDFERDIFDGRTLNELLHERGGV